MAYSPRIIPFYVASISRSRSAPKEEVIDLLARKLRLLRGSAESLVEKAIKARLVNQDGHNLSLENNKDIAA